MNTRPRVIMHVITDLNVGGAERSLANLVMHMNSKDYTNVVVSLQDLGYWGPILQQQGFEVFALNMRNSILSLGACVKLLQLMRLYKPDYVQGWMYHANLIALLFGKLAGVKRIYWNIRCSIMQLEKYSLSTRVVFKLGAWMSSFADAIINNSQRSIEQHKHYGYKNNNWLHIANGFDVNRFTPNLELYTEFRLKHNLPDDAVIIGMVARFDPMKDHLTFIRAAKQLTAKLPNVYFVCAGKDVNYDNPILNNELQDLVLKSRVILIDQTQKVEALYPVFDYLTQTSVFGEGFPNVVAEAMACGVPCFVTDVGDSNEVIGEQGISIPSSNPQQLCQIWYDAIITRQVPSNTAVRQRILEKFSLERCIDAYCGAYSY